MKWQTIDTAPKDKPVLLWGFFWGDNVFYEPLIGRWWPNNDRWEADATYKYGIRPTHWMPLPAKPGAT